MPAIAPGTTSYITTVFIQDSTSTTGAGKTGLLFNASGLTCYYKKSDGSVSVAVTLVNITTLGTFASGGFKEIDAVHQPGLYEFHPPDLGQSSGTNTAYFFTGATGMAATVLGIDLPAAASAAPTVAQIAAGVWQDITAGDFTTAGSIGKSLFTSGNAPGTAGGHAIVGSNMGTVTSVTGSVGSVTAGVTVTTNNDKTGYSLTVAPPTAAAIATSVWQDATAGDFTVASSIGKALYIANIAPGAAGGHFIAGTNAATTVNFTGNLSGSVGSVTGTVGSVTGSVGSVVGLTNATIATSVWTDTTAGDFLTLSSPGKILVTQLGGTFTTTSSSVFTVGALVNAPTGGSAPTVAQIATGVWEDLLASGDFAVPGSIGARLLANVDAPISTRSTYAGTDTPGTTTLVSLLTPTRAGYLDNLAGGPVALASGVILTSAGLDQVVVETGLNARQSLAIIASATAGKSTGVDTGSPAVYFGAGVANARITATCSNGNRSAVTLAPPA